MKIEATTPMNSHETASVNTDNPWPGLESYREIDREFFHGRTDEADQLHRLVMRERLTVFFGLSGLGKSSLLQAGLFPTLRLQNVLPIYIRLGFSPDDPSLKIQVKQAIASEATIAKVEASRGEEHETFWEYFHHQDADFWSERNRLMLPLLVFDQFEEIFTLGRLNSDSINNSNAFLTELGDLIEGRPPSALKKRLDEQPQDASKFRFGRHHYKVLLSLREDFLPDLEELRERIPSVIKNRMRLRPMNGASAFQVVAHARNLIEPHVAEQVVRFIAAKKHSDTALKKLSLEPALLSVVCRELNNKRQLRKEPRITEDLLEGTHAEILSEFYERGVADLSNKVRVFVEDQLLTVSGYRDSVALENALSLPGITSDAIDQMVDRRLIRREERAGMERLELTHDLLTGVILASRDRRHQLEAEAQHKKEINEKEERQRLVEHARSARRFRLLTAALTILCLITLFAFYRAYELKTQADQGFKKIQESVKLRQAILSRDKEALKPVLERTSVDTQIEFGAKATEYPYQSVGGSPTFKFQMFPIEQSLAGGLETIALITYILDHPTFLNPLIITGPDTKFTGTYDGIGCLYVVKAVIEYSDLDKPLAIAEFDMCEVVKWHRRKKIKGK